MNGKLRNTLLGAAGAMISAVVIRRSLWEAFDRNMVGTALDREEPKAMRKMKERIKGDGEALEEVMALCQQLGQRLEARPHEILRITSHDGTELVGHLFRNPEQKRLVLAMHGWRSSWARDFGAVADFLEDTGCTVLYAEQRGQGDSGGEYMGFGMIERFDCLEWIKWLNENGFADCKIYLAGISMGASTVLMTAGFSELPENVAGVIADCGFTSAKAEWKYISEKNLRIPYGRRGKHLDALCRKRIDLASDAYTTLDAMKTCRLPILFVHGQEDTFVPPEMTLENYEACRSAKELLLVPGANHGMSYFCDQVGYEGAVKNFFRQQEG